MNSPQKIPKRIGKYQVIERLANGTMGVVYEGYDPIAERPVAIKVSLAEHIKDKQQQRRFNELFVREAKTASLLHHPNILEIYDCGIDQGRYYIVMELVRHARTIKDFISDEELLKPEEAVDMIIQCAEGLKYAHLQGIIHRDIKPANLLVTEDKKVKIADFSIAFVEQPDFDMTMPTGFVGSPRYMSPEQVQEDVITSQSDLYSLGVVMFELLTGKHPFEAESFSRLIYKVVNEDPPDPLSIKPDLPEKLATYMRHALIKDPEKRFQSASEMIKYLKRVFPGTGHSSEQNIMTTPLEVQLSDNKSFKQFRPLSLFASLSEAELRTVSQYCEWLEFKDGEQIINHGYPIDALYFLLEGELSDQQIKKGECFGEISFLSEETSLTAVHAVGKVRVLKIKRESLDQLPDICQLKLYKALSKKMAENLNDQSLPDRSLAIRPSVEPS